MKSYRFKISTILCSLILLFGVGQVQPFTQTDVTEMQKVVAKIYENCQAIDTILDEFTAKNVPATFSCTQFGQKCQETMKFMAENIMTPLKEKLEDTRKTNAGSTYHKILEKTHELATDVYQVIEKLYVIWNTQLTSTNRLDITPFATDLNGVFGTAEKLGIDKRVNELELLIKAEKATVIVEEIAKIQALAVIMKTKLVERMKNKLLLYKNWRIMFSKP